MILLVAATEREMHPLSRSLAPSAEYQTCVTGIGPLEAAISITRMLASLKGATPELVLLFGVGGAYPEGGSCVLDLCLATHEIWADYGIRYDDRVEPFCDPALSTDTVFPLDNARIERSCATLARHGINSRSGVFVTVSCASGTGKRGRELYLRHRGICENMEGAAVARVLKDFGIPCVEVRCISNMVEDRDLSRWNLEGAVAKCASAAALLLDEFAGRTLSKAERS